MTIVERVSEVARAVEWVRARGGWIAIYAERGFRRLDFGVPYEPGRRYFTPEETRHELALIGCPEVVAYLVGRPEVSFAPVGPN